MNYFETSEGFTIMNRIANSMEQIAKELHDLNDKMSEVPKKADLDEVKAISDRLMKEHAEAYASLANSEDDLVVKDDTIEGNEVSSFDEVRVQFTANMEVNYGGVLKVSGQDLKDMGMTSWDEFFDENGKPREGLPEDFLIELADKAYYEANQKASEDYIDEYWEGSNNEYNYDFEQEQMVF